MADPGQHPQPQPRAPGQDRGKAVPVKPGGCQIEQAAPEGQHREQDDPAQRIEQENQMGRGSSFIQDTSGPDFGKDGYNEKSTVINRAFSLLWLPD